MANGPSVGVVLALGASHLGDVGLQQLGEDVQADVDSRRQQAVTHMRGEDLQLAFDLFRQRCRQAGRIEVDKPKSRHQSKIASRGSRGV